MSAEALVDRVALALLNDDRTRNGWLAFDTLSRMRDEDAEAYRGSARAALAVCSDAREGLKAGIEAAAMAADAKADQLEALPPVLLGWTVTRSNIRVLRENATAIRALGDGR